MPLPLVPGNVIGGGGGGGAGGAGGGGGGGGPHWGGATTVLVSRSCFPSSSTENVGRIYIFLPYDNLSVSCRIVGFSIIILL